MKAKSITYSRLVSKGNFENAKIELQLEVEEGEKAQDVFNAAKTFVDRRCEIEKMGWHEYVKAKKVLAEKRQYTLGQIEEAEEIISKFESQMEDEIPF